MLQPVNDTVLLAFDTISHYYPSQISPSLPGVVMPYVDGYVIPIPKKNVDFYVGIAKKAAKIWCEHGALEYRESVGDDMACKWGVPFPKLLDLKTGETVIFAWITYKSRAHRDRVNAKVMKDPRIAAMMDESDMPFDSKRMVYGGFEIVVKSK